MGNEYSKFYTPQEVSDALVKLIDFKSNAKVVDICCGSGNLLMAAKKVNNTLKCYGVDIIEKEERKFRYINEDGRSYALRKEKYFDYALANPPFSIDTSTDFSSLLFTGNYKRINSKRLEIEMLIANLFILKNKGTLLIIIPTTFVEGSRSQNIRKHIAANTYIKTIVDLPVTAFNPYKIKCSALIIQKTMNKLDLPTEYYSMSSSLIITNTKTISAKMMKSGDWIDCKSKNIGEFSIKQGKISSNHFTQDGIPVLHTGKRANIWKPSVRYLKSILKDNQVKAEKGDILVSRIGCSAGQKCIYKGDSTYISDCLFVIKTENEQIKRNIMKLDLTMLVVGLSTPYITAKSIYELYQSYVE